MKLCGKTTNTEEVTGWKSAYNDGDTSIDQATNCV